MYVNLVSIGCIISQIPPSESFILTDEEIEAYEDKLIEQVRVDVDWPNIYATVPRSGKWTECVKQKNRKNAIWNCM